MVEGPETAKELKSDKSGSSLSMPGEPAKSTLPPLSPPPSSSLEKSSTLPLMPPPNKLPPLKPPPASSPSSFEPELKLVPHEERSDSDQHQQPSQKMVPPDQGEPALVASHPLGQALQQPGMPLESSSTSKITVTPDATKGESYSLAQLKSVLSSLSSPQRSDEESREEALAILAAYECWEPYLALVESFIKEATDYELRREYTQRIARVYLNDVEDYRRAADFLAHAAVSLKMPFNLFWRYCISEIRLYKDYRVEAEIIETIIIRHRDHNFLEKAYERLILLYEEKLYEEDNIPLAYEKLLVVNSKNQKALKFYKNLHMQRHEWGEIEKYLLALVASCTEPREEHHYRVELATVYLHYLDETQKALEILDAVDVHAGFEACKVKFSLLFLIGEFKKALGALQPLKTLAETPQLKACVYYHLAVTYQNLGASDKALESFQQSLRKYLSVYVLKKYTGAALSSRNTTHILGVMRYLEKAIEALEMSPDNRAAVRGEAKRVYNQLLKVHRAS